MPANPKSDVLSLMIERSLPKVIAIGSHSGRRTHGDKPKKMSVSVSYRQNVVIVLPNFNHVISAVPAARQCPRLENWWEGGMADLRKRFGQLVAAHRRRQGLTQEGLAEAADLSPEMVAKIETGKSGARFPVIERIAAALEIDPAELFTTQLPTGVFQKGAFAALSMRLVSLSESDLLWIGRIIDAILSSKIANSSRETPLEKTSPKTRASRPRASRRS
jgi:transcriptional regulator with XRE-family HTH domain